jgi:hypothetical protein
MKWGLRGGTVSERKRGGMRIDLSLILHHWRQSTLQLVSFCNLTVRMILISFNSYWQFLKSTTYLEESSTQMRPLCGDRFKKSSNRFIDYHISSNLELDHQFSPTPV